MVVELTPTNCSQLLLCFVSDGLHAGACICKANRGVSSCCQTEVGCGVGDGDLLLFGSGCLLRVLLQGVWEGVCLCCGEGPVVVGGGAGRDIAAVSA